MFAYELFKFVFVITEAADMFYLSGYVRQK